MTDEIIQNELSALKMQADQIGVSYSRNIGVEKLSARIEDALSNREPIVEASVTKTKETTGQRRSRLRKEAGALVRVHVTCMNPNKREWEGEIFTVANAVVGTFKHYVPFNIEDGWHIPTIILQQVKARKCQVFKTVNGPRGEKIRKGTLIPEFSVDVLTPLTEKELADLAKRQAMAGGLGD